MAEQAVVWALHSDVSITLQQKGPLRETLQRCAEAMVRHLDAAFVRIWTLNQGDQILEMQASRGMYTHLDGFHSRVPVGQFKIGLIAQERKPHLTNTVIGDPRVHDQQWARREGMVAFAGYPLIVEDRTVGVMALFARHALTEVVLEAMDSVALVIAQGIDRKWAEEKIQRNLEQMQALHEIETALTSTLDLQTVLSVLLEKIDLLLPSSRITIRLWNRETGNLEPIASRNVDAEKWKQELWHAPTGLALAVFESRSPLAVADLRSDPRTRNFEFFRSEGLVSYLGLPLIVKDEILGVLGLYLKERHDFGKEKIELLSTLAAQAATAIHNSQLYEQTRKQAVDLERSSKVKSEFLGVMSHELRTPLNVIMGYTAMMKNGLLGETNQGQGKALERVLKHSGELLAMINGVLEATRIEAGGVVMERQAVHLRSFLDGLQSAYAALPSQRLALIWDYPPDLPVLQTDAEKLKYILQNLIYNGIKFTEKGSVTVSARHIPEAKTVELKVADTGIGIANENFPIIFDMFRQVDSSETRSYGGVGLGLYIVKKFTEMLGGKVEVESEPGKGSTFTVRLPYN